MWFANTSNPVHWQEKKIEETIVGYAEEFEDAEELIDVVSAHLRHKYNMRFANVSQDSPATLVSQEGCVSVTIKGRILHVNSVDLSLL